MKTLIRNVAILDAGGTLIEDGHIVIADERIESISASSNNAPIVYDEVIDGRGKLALPGLVNTHGHAAMSLLRGYADDMPLAAWLADKIWPAESTLTSAEIRLGTELAMLEMIETGTTTFTDMYFSMDQVAEAVIDAGMRGVLGHGIIGIGTNAHRDLADAEALYHAYDRAGNGRVRVTIAPHAPYTCPPEYLASVIAMAERLDAPVQIHLAETRREVQECQAQFGVSPTELLASTGLFSLRTLVAHAVHVTDRDLDILAAHAVHVAHNPGSNLKLGSGIAPLTKMLDRGLIVGLGTDGAASNNKLDIWAEIRLVALLHKGLLEDAVAIPAQEALRLGTVLGAQALFLEEGLGLLRAGAPADIQLIDITGPRYFPRHNLLSHVVYSLCGTDVTHVFVAGKLLYQNRQFLTLDAERITWESERAMARLLAPAAL